MSEWKHIELYQSSQADAYKTVLEVAPELTVSTKKWLQTKYEIAIEERDKARAAQNA